MPRIMIKGGVWRNTEVSDGRYFRYVKLRSCQQSLGSTELLIVMFNTTSVECIWAALTPQALSPLLDFAVQLKTGSSVRFHSVNCGQHVMNISRRILWNCLKTCTLGHLPMLNNFTTL